MDDNGGDIPNGLFLQKRERLSDLIFDFTGNRPDDDMAVKDLVPQIIELADNTEVTISGEFFDAIEKLEADAAKDDGGRKRKRQARPRWALEALDPLQVVEMKRILHVNALTMSERYKGNELIHTWDFVGMQTPYPTNWNYSKLDAITMMRQFAAKNLIYHKQKGLLRGAFSCYEQ